MLAQGSHRGIGSGLVSASQDLSRDAMFLCPAAVSVVSVVAPRVPGTNQSFCFQDAVQAVLASLVIGL